MASIIFVVFIFVSYSLFCGVDGRYTCICNYDVQTSVMPDASSDGPPIGYLYEFDCKAKLTDPSTPQWLAIAFNHQTGYIKANPQVQEQTCSGSIAEGDKVSTIKPTGQVTVPSITFPTMFKENGTGTLESTTNTQRPSTNSITTQTTLPNTSISNSVTQHTNTVLQTSTKLSTFPTVYSEQTTTTGSTLAKGSTTAKGPTTEKGSQTTKAQTTYLTQPVIISSSPPAVMTGSTKPVPTTYVATTAMATNMMSNIAVPGDTNRCPVSVKRQTSLDHGTLGYYNNSCYELISSVSVAHEHALQMCRSRGGDLVDILDNSEQQFVEKFLLRYSPTHAVWTGLHDRNNENYFQWTSGAPVNFTNWIPGHTSNFASHHQEDCVVMVPYKQGLWDDIPCGAYFSLGADLGATYPALCEYSGLTMCKPCHKRFHPKCERHVTALRPEDILCDQCLMNNAVFICPQCADGVKIFKMCEACEEIRHTGLYITHKDHLMTPLY